MLSTSDLLKAERRAKREARRAKQREQNLDRAKKMHAARISGAYSDASSSVSKDKNSLPVPIYHVGCSGWFYWHWKNLFYSSDLPTNKWFGHYIKNFQTVELNAPFYSWPTIATIHTWKKQATKKSFVYTVKVSELITHIKRFRGTKELIKDFGLIADFLGPHMGCFLFQLPPSFHYTAARLKAITSQLDPRRRNVVEFRHPSWWNNVVFKAFKKAGIIFCSCSGPKLPDELIKTADDIYIRFHGTSQWYRHEYSSEELAIWADRIRKSGATQVWAYFNNDREGFAIKNAKDLSKRLRKLKT